MKLAEILDVFEELGYDVSLVKPKDGVFENLYAIAVRRQSGELFHASLVFLFKFEKTMNVKKRVDAHFKNLKALQFPLDVIFIYFVHKDGKVVTLYKAHPFYYLPKYIHKEEVVTV